MNWRVVFARPAKKELAKLSSETQLRIGHAIRSLENNPTPGASKRLSGRDQFRLRVSDYRILYQLHHADRVIDIRAIGHRREVYR